MNEFASRGSCAARASRTCACLLAVWVFTPLLCQPIYAQVDDQPAKTASPASTASTASASVPGAPSASSPSRNEKATEHLEPPANIIELQGAILKTIDATTLAARIAGPIKELLVKEGDIVSTGQALGTIDDEALRLELEQLQTQVAVAKKKHSDDINQRLAEKSQQVASTEYERALNANARVADTYPINEIDRLRLIADRAALEVERAAYDQELAVFEVTLAKGNYGQAYERYMRHRVIAPAGGVVVSVEKRVGEWVEPGTDLLRIVRIDQLRVEGFIPANQAHTELVGQPARVALLGEADDSWKDGKVVFVSPDANPVNSQVRVFIELENEQGALRPGLRVRAIIDASTK